MNRLIIALLLSSCNGLLNSADADDNRPLLLNVIELSSETYRVTLRVPPTLPHVNQPVLVLSERTDADNSGTERPDQQIVDTGSQRIIQCIGGLQGKWLELRYPLQPPPVGTVIRMTFADQQTQTAVLTPGETAWQVPYPAARLSVARDYFRLGLHHIWAGMDHLLFVACLICIAGTWRRTFATITGFTIRAFYHACTLLVRHRTTSRPTDRGIDRTERRVSREGSCQRVPRESDLETPNHHFERLWSTSWPWFCSSPESDWPATIRPCDRTSVLQPWC